MHVFAHEFVQFQSCPPLSAGRLVTLQALLSTDDVILFHHYWGMFYRILGILTPRFAGTPGSQKQRKILTIDS